MMTMSVPVTGAPGSGLRLEGTVQIPDGWNEPPMVPGVTMVLPEDLARYAALGFVPNITLSSGEALPGVPVTEVASALDVVIARDVVGDDGTGAERTSWLAVTSVDGVSVVQVAGRWRREDMWFEVVCSAGADEWDELAVAFDDIIGSAGLVADRDDDPR